MSVDNNLASVSSFLVCFNYLGVITTLWVVLLHITPCFVSVVGLFLLGDNGFIYLFLFCCFCLWLFWLWAWAAPLLDQLFIVRGMFNRVCSVHGYPYIGVHPRRFNYLLKQCVSTQFSFNLLGYFLLFSFCLLVLAVFLVVLFL